ncbi:MAG: polysaccharide deacetylase family protein [Bryobacteraceae bacterium]
MIVEFTAGGLMVAGVMAYGVRGRSSSFFGPSVFRGARTRPSVALTFDDGPSESTPDLLDVLDQCGVKATFFQCGAPVRRLPEIARAVAEAGHEIGNHTYSHAALYLRSPRFIYEELLRAQDTIGEVTGIRPRLFRAPLGARWFGLRQAQERLGLLGVMWTTIGRDWTLPAPKIAKRIQAGAEPGAIICLHDGRDTRPNPDVRPTIEAVRQVIPQLRDRGFEFETVSQILCPLPTTPRN